MTKEDIIKLLAMIKNKDPNLPEGVFATRDFREVTGLSATTTRGQLRQLLKEGIIEIDKMYSRVNILNLNVTPVQHYCLKKGNKRGKKKTN